MKKNMKRLLALLLAVVMVASVFAGCTDDKDPTKPTDNTEPTKTTEPTTKVEMPPVGGTDEEIYDYVLGDFNEVYQKALESQDVSERFVLEAIAEAKLLESGTFMPTTSQGGRYAISRVVPNTISSVLWGYDSDRFKTAIVTNEIITAEDRTALKAMWQEAATADEYFTKAKTYLGQKGYTLANAYNVPNSADPQTWDMFATYQANDSEKIVHTFDGLIEYDAKNNLIPALAESWEANADNTVFTFKIRKGATWVDNQGRKIADVTAHDFVSGMHHMMDAQGGLEYLVDGVIVNASEYMGKEITDFSQVGVKALDDYTLQYTLTGPCTYFLTMMGYTVFAPMNADFFQSQGGVFGVDEFAAASQTETYKYGTSPETIAYCGAFLITNFTAENTIVYKANPTYWNAAAMNIQEMSWFYNDGTDSTKAYKDTVAGTISGASLTAASLESAKADGNFDKYAYISATDATAFSAYWNVNRKAFANYNDETVGVSQKTDAQKEASALAMMNVHFRRALTRSVDRAAVNAVVNGEDLKYSNMINAYTPGTFVALEHDVTVDINGTATTFKAGTKYGEIVQAQLIADGSTIKAYDPAADDGFGSSAGFDGWYNPEVAAAEMKIAIDELKAWGLEVSKENPIVLDYACWDSAEVYKNQGEAYKQSIEKTLDGYVIVNLVPFATQKEYYNSTYFPQTGAEMNYDINTNTGWGPDYGDPKSYLDTMLPTAGGMAKSIGLF